MKIYRRIRALCRLYHIDWKFIKFLFVGCLNTAFGYSVYALFLFLRFHYAAASFLSTILGILFNFKTTGTIVFKNSDNKLIFKFFGVYGITYCVNVLCLKCFKMIDFNMYWAGLILTFPMAMLSFTLMKYLVFKKK